MLQRRVALKVLPRKLSNQSSALERFHREARALARLNHDNIVRVYDVDVHDKTHFIVMEFVQGFDLYRKVAKEGPLDEAIAANFIVQAAAGLSHAHDVGLIHRDVKPANMLIDQQGTVKLLDLGLALLQTDEDGSLTADPSKALGTADYISPEQALNSHELDSRTDIYSLGCSLYFLLTGRAPFGSGTSAERLLAHQLKEAEPINNIRISQNLVPVDERLVGICDRMMAKSPDARYSSAAEVAEALSPLAGTSTAVEFALRSSSSAATSPKPHGSQSTLDTDSLEQLKTISESASIASSSSTAKKQRASDQLRTSKSGKNRAAIWSVLILGVAVTLATVGMFLRQDSTTESAQPPPRPAETFRASAASDNFEGPFFVVGKNRTYHTKACHHVKGKDNARQVTQNMLDAGDLRPCRTCRPASKP